MCSLLESMYTVCIECRPYFLDESVGVVFEFLVYCVWNLNQAGLQKQKSGSLHGGTKSIHARVRYCKESKTR